MSSEEVTKVKTEPVFESENKVSVKQRRLKTNRKSPLPQYVKMKIINRLEQGETVEKMCEDYQVAERTVKRIQKESQSVKQYVHSLAVNGGYDVEGHYHGVEKTMLENVVTSWFLQKRSLGEPVYGWAIQEKALEFNKLLQGPSNFKASNGWLYKFKCRHGIQSLSLQGEREPHTGLASQEFRVVFSTFLMKNGYQEEDVYNAKETGICWKSLPTILETQLGAEVKEDLFKREDHATILFCSNLTGTHKLPLFVVGKEFVSFESLKEESLPVTYVCNEDGLIDKETFCHWYQYMFLPHIKYKNQNNEETRKVVLLLDNALVHLDLQSIDSPHTCCRVVHLPTNVAAPVQPMCQGIIYKTIKHYRTQLLRDICSDYQSDCDEFVKDCTITKFCHKVANAWNKVPKTDLRSAWSKVYKMKRANTKLNDSYEEICELVSQLCQDEDVSDDDIQAWVKQSTPGWKILTDAEVVQQVTGIFPNIKQEPEDDTKMEVNEVESAEDRDDSNSSDSETKVISPVEALLALDQLNNFCENHWQFDHEDLAFLTKIRQTVKIIASETR